MPISDEQVTQYLDNYSELGNLHVYGDLLGLYSLPVHATVADVASIFSDIRSLDHRILTVYVSYVMARVGFYQQALARGDFPERLYTTEFKDSDWLENLILFEHEMEGYRDKWVMYFENERNERIKIVFVTLLYSHKDPQTGEYSEATYLLKLIDESASNYIIVHPRLSRKAKNTFIKAKEQMKRIMGKDVVLSTGQFVSRLIPNNDKRQIVEANWDVLREKIVQTLQKKWPILIYSIHNEQLLDVRERLRKSRLKYELGLELEDSIKDAAISCESLLQILNSIFTRKLDKKMEFYDLLCNLKDVIIEEFGKDTYDDLNLIRDWRNKVLHPPVATPDASTTLKIIAKAELFHELFHKKIRLKG